jgi:Flp pilus assembly pilin Flp
VKLAGIDVGLLAMEELAVRLEAAGNRALAAGLHQAVAEGQVASGLTAEQREVILDALRSCPAGLLRLRDELRAQSGQTMAEYAGILGGIALVVIVAIVFLGGRIGELFGGTGSSIQPARSAPFSPPSPGDVAFPATIHDCQNGHWRTYPQFRTEAECTAYVEELMP